MGKPADVSSEDLALDPRLAGPTVARRLLGLRLRALREARGISREEAGTTIRASPSKISRLELGRNGFKQRDVADLLTLYGVTDQTERANLLALVDPARTPGWLRAYTDLLPAGAESQLELEQAASLIRGYQPQLVPALLRTPDYARAVAELEHPDAAPPELRRRVDLLIRRQQVLGLPGGPELWMIVDEAALRRRIGSPATMYSQLTHLIDVADAAHVTVQVMPFSAGVVAGGAITLLRFPEAELDDVVQLDQVGGTLELTQPADVAHYRAVLDRLSIRAEPPAATPVHLRWILDDS